jgi:hypothetical protein
MASTDAEQRARHISLTIDGHDSNAATALEGVAHQAMQRGAPDAAAELAELSCVLTPTGDAADLCRRHTLAGQARFAAGDTVKALEHLSTAQVLAAAGPERAGVRLRVARVRYHHDNIGAAGEILAQARLDAGDDARLQAAIDHDLAYTYFAAQSTSSPMPSGRSRWPTSCSEWVCKTISSLGRCCSRSGTNPVPRCCDRALP